VGGAAARAAADEKRSPAASSAAAGEAADRAALDTAATAADRRSDGDVEAPPSCSVAGRGYNLVAGGSSGLERGCRRGHALGGPIGAGGRGERGVGDATVDADAGLAVRGRGEGRRGALEGRCPPGGRGAGVAEVRGAGQPVAAATAGLPVSVAARGDGGDGESRRATSPSRSGHEAAASAAAQGSGSGNTAGAAAADGGRGGASGVGDGGRAPPADPGGDEHGVGAAAAGGGGDGGGPPSSSAAAATADAVAAGDNESPTARGRGHGRGWTEAERVALFQAWLVVAQDPVVGTDQSRAPFAAAIVKGYKSHCPIGPGRRARTDIAIDRELRNSVFKNVQRFSSSMVAVGRRQMTGILTDENLIRMATAHFDAENLYETVQVDDNDGDAPVLVVKKGGTRGADWVKCWTVMRKLDKFSGASGAAATAAAARGRRPVPDGGVEDISDDDSSSTVGRRRGLFQERPIGTTATKAAASTDIAIQREAATTAAALKSLSETAIDRADIDFWKAKDVRETGEAEQWRKNEMERRLLLSNARLRKAKAAEARVASCSTTTARLCRAPLRPLPRPLRRPRVRP